MYEKKIDVKTINDIKEKVFPMIFLNNRTNKDTITNTHKTIKNIIFDFLFFSNRKVKIITFFARFIDLSNIFIDKPLKNAFCRDIIDNWKEIYLHTRKDF